MYKAISSSRSFLSVSLNSCLQQSSLSLSSCVAAGSFDRRHATTLQQSMFRPDHYDFEAIIFSTHGQTQSFAGKSPMCNMPVYSLASFGRPYSEGTEADEVRINLIEFGAEYPARGRWRVEKHGWIVAADSIEGSKRTRWLHCKAYSRHTVSTASSF